MRYFICVAGFCGSKVVKTLNCSDCFHTISNSSIRNQNKCRNRMIKLLSNGRLIYPSDKLFRLFNRLEKLLNGSISGGKINAYTVINLMENIRQKKLSPIGCHEHQQECTTRLVQPSAKAIGNEVHFTISPETLQKSAKERISIPRFLITGRLDATECCLTKPFTGHVTVQHTEVPIKSIEVQLVRVETCGCAEGYSRDATEIQNIQVAEGNVCPKLHIPIHMILPRLFTCPTLITKNFKVEFELNLVILFQDDYLVTENFEIILNRCN